MLDFKTNEEYVLEDDCVLLRPLRAEDCGNLPDYSLHEPEIWRYSLVQAGGEENLKHYINIALAARQAGNEYPFVVFDKRTQEYAGSTRLYEINLPHRSLLLGYTWYGKKFQGTGLNKHCKYMLLQFAFEQMEMERVEFRADLNNARSIAAMKSIGCTVEGVLRSHQPSGYSQARRDSIILSILKDEWFSRVKAHLMDQMNSQAT